MRTLLGGPMPEAVATGCAVLDAQVIAWLNLHEERGIRRDYVPFRGHEVVVCSFEDRGRIYRALSSRNWEDAVRNALGIGLDEDAFEQANVGRPHPHWSFALPLEQWLRYRHEVTP